MMFYDTEYDFIFPQFTLQNDKLNSLITFFHTFDDVGDVWKLYYILLYNKDELSVFSLSNHYMILKLIYFHKDTCNILFFGLKLHLKKSNTEGMENETKER